MDTQKIQSIAGLAAKSERIAILIGDAPREADFLAAHALKNRFGAKAMLIGTPKNLEAAWESLFTKEVARKEFAIALDIEHNPIDELRYEKDGNKLRIFVSPQNPISKESIEVEEFYPPFDIAVCIGFSSKTVLDEKLREITVK